jgi:hypothetical protein
MHGKFSGFPSKAPISVYAKKRVVTDLSYTAILQESPHLITNYKITKSKVLVK